MVKKEYECTPLRSEWLGLWPRRRGLREAAAANTGTFLHWGLLGTGLFGRPSLSQP